jgi:hypothetical protein
VIQPRQNPVGHAERQLDQPAADQQLNMRRQQQPGPAKRLRQSFGAEDQPAQQRAHRKMQQRRFDHPAA